MRYALSVMTEEIRICTMTDQESKQKVEHTVCRNPATGEILGYSSLTDLQELEHIISRAKLAQKSWSKLEVSERVKYVLQIRNYLVQHAEEISEVISKDNGKTRVDALATEVLPAAMAVSYYAKHAKKYLKTRYICPGNILLLNKVSKIVRVPYGVVGVISPWNYPFAIPFSEVVMALLAGNGVVLKTASETQWVGRTMEECFLAAKLPEGIFNYVNLPGRTAGSAFLRNNIDKLFFTGSVATGKQLMSEAGKTLTPLVLELGGNDAMLVCEDADIFRATSGAVWAGFQNSGQSCASVERVYVHEKVYHSFLQLLKMKVEALRVGFEEDFEIDIGAMTTERQVSKVKSHLDDALARGARVYARSAEPEGKSSNTVFPAMVLTEVNHDMLLMQEETFGPLLGVMKVRDMDEAVALANNSHLGLTGSVWSRNRCRAERLARQIQAGVVTINDHSVSHGMAETPWGGVKHSGIGRSHGAIGFDEMTQPQVIVHDILPRARQNIWWHPHGTKVYEGLLGAIRFLYSTSIRQRVTGFYRLLKVLPRYFSTRA
jgi:acyl-CoA reductase-like NAD-dependent aldehyde dehydrogenase